MKTSAPIHEAEWRFSRCRKDELQACMLYEYSREAGLPRIESITFQRMVDGATPQQEVRHHVDYPRRPWLEIDPNARRLLTKRAGACGHEDIFIYYEDDNNPAPRTELNWKLSDRQLKEGFARMLKRRPFAHQRIGGRTDTPRDNLNALCALRLLHHFRRSSEDALLFLEENLHKPMYSDERALRKAAAKAKRIVAEFRRFP